MGEASIVDLDLDDVKRGLRDGSITLVDVREPHEFAAGHIPGSVHIPFGQLPQRLGEVPRERAVATICSGGKRSGLAASLLQREGYEHVIHVAHGGVGTWERSGRDVEKF
jgi:hydroxyacylglutathione hydrolase